jgi:hypothetical protein
MGTDAGILLPHKLMNPLCKKLPGLQPEPLHHQILNTVAPASTALLSFVIQRGCHQYQCTTILWNLLRSQYCHHNNTSWHVQGWHHVAQHSSWCDPLHSKCCTILLTANVLYHVISMHLAYSTKQSQASDSGQRYLGCSGATVQAVALGVLCKGDPSASCQRETWFSVHGYDFV